MSLPKIPTLTYDIEIPGYPEKFKIRPFLVKEYRELIQAKEYDNDNSFVNAIKNVVEQCTFYKVNVDELPIYIIDFLFLKIRAKSVGEVIRTEYRCTKLIEKTKEDGTVVSEPCDTRFGVPVNLDKAYIHYPPNFNEKSIIQVTDTIGIQFKMPTFAKFRSVGIEGKGIFEITDEYIYSCVDCVFDGDKVLLPEKDFNFKEFVEFIETFPSDSIDKISWFFGNQPRIKLDLHLQCPMCGNESDIQLDGIDDFFD